jgi:hypothetical protein
MFPSTFSTCSNEGEPNTTVISQVWYVDEEHVALSFQFFSKTRKNIAENPFGYVSITNPMTMDMYGLEIEFVRSETDGDLFDDMDMKLQAIASMSGMEDIFELKAADIYKVHKIMNIAV